MAGAQIADLKALLTTVYPTSATLNRAVRGVSEHNLSLWKARLWSTFRDGGVTALLREDLQDGRALGGVLFRDLLKTDDLLLSPVWPGTGPRNRMSVPLGPLPGSFLPSM